MGKFDLGDGSQVRFWEDSWIRSRPLKTLFPTLYNIVRRKSATARSVLATTPLNVAFRRSLMGVNLRAWHEVVAGCRCTTNEPERSLCVGATSQWAVLSQLHVHNFVRNTSYTV